mmetsp:Transcript_55549/g.89972  ORF Transcript_55549/g.89972 Transcript_55549/m.89972 type:complete len:268 (-) Transcript_55549:331-1134(-)
MTLDRSSWKRERTTLERKSNLHMFPNMPSSGQRMSYTWPFSRCLGMSNQMISSPGIVMSCRVRSSLEAGTTISFFIVGCGTCERTCGVAISLATPSRSYTPRCLTNFVVILLQLGPMGLSFHQLTKKVIRSRPLPRSCMMVPSCNSGAKNAGTPCCRFPWKRRWRFLAGYEITPWSGVMGIAPFPSGVVWLKTTVGAPLSVMYVTVDTSGNFMVDLSDAMASSLSWWNPMSSLRSRFCTHHSPPLTRGWGVFWPMSISYKSWMAASI